VLRHGSGATSFQTLQSGYRYFFHRDCACVAFVDTGSAWVAAGAPIAAAAELPAVVDAFLSAARLAGRRVCFFGTEAALVGASGAPLGTLAIGEQPVWDPRAWATRLARHRSLREQLRRARAKGVRIREVPASELESDALRAQITRVTERWLGARSMAPMGFLVKVEPFGFAAQRHTFVAEQDGRLLGFAGLIPVPARAGWFLEDLVRDPEAPNGTGELLVHAVMQWAGAANCSWLTLGLSPLSGPLPPFLSRARQSSRWLYDFVGLRAYKAKFTPDSWQAVYLCFPRSQYLWLTVLDTLRAFATGGLIRFGLRTLLRGPALVLRALTTLLIPWTLLLMLAQSQRWFGSVWAKWAWVLFDVLLAGSLIGLRSRPTVKWLTVLAVAVTTDAVVTLLEALLWNVRHARGALDYLVLTVACTGPSLAALVLWGARSHRLRSL